MLLLGGLLQPGHLEGRCRRRLFRRVLQQLLLLLLQYVLLLGH